MSPPPDHSDRSPEPVTPARSAWTLPILVFLVGAALALGFTRHVYRQAATERETAIVADAALMTSEIRERLRAHAQFLRGVRAFVSVLGTVSRDDWRAFAQLLLVEKNISGIQAYGFAPAVSRSEQSAFTERMRRQSGMAEFAIHPLPPESRPLALPIVYLAPETSFNLPATGYNLFSEQRRIEAIELARDRNEIVLSGRIELVTETQDKIRQPGLLMVLPVYRVGTPIDSVEARRAAFAGVVFAAYRMQDLMQSLNFATSNKLGLRIFDDEAFNRGGSGRALTFLYAEGSDDRHEVVEERELEFGLRNWHLRFTSLDEGSSRQEILFMGLGGTLVSLLLALISRAQVTHRQRAEALAREMTQDLRVSEERFQLAVAGTEDGIFDRDLTTGRIWRSDRLRTILGEGKDIAFDRIEDFLDRIHPEDRTGAEAALRDHYEKRSPYRSEYRFHKGDGSWIWLQSRGRAVWDAGGKPVRLVGSITDITAQRLAEQRAESYRCFLATVLKFIPHPVFVKSEARQYIAVNAAFCQLVERAEADILGKETPAVVPYSSDVLMQVQIIDDRVFAGGGEQIEEYVVPLRRGARIVVTRKTLARDPDGQPILIGTMTDMTDLRHAERELGDVVRQQKAILDAASEVAIIATDISGTIRVFNRGAEKMLGYRADEVVGQHSPATFHVTDEVGEQMRFLSAELGRDISGFEVFTVGARTYGSERREWTYVRKDGVRLRVSLGVTAVRDERGEITGYLGIAIDVSAREQALAELKMQIARTQTIIEHIPGGVSLIDRELNFTAANEELKRVLNFPDSLFASGSPSLYEVALFNARRGEYGPGDPKQQAMSVVERARHPVPHCFERTRPDGRTIEVRGTPLPDGGFVTIYTDVTTRKEVEAELRRHRDRLQELVDAQTAGLLAAKEAAERASEAKSEFLANMSHELRTPMHAVLSFASLGMEKSASAEPEKLAHYFDRIHRSGSRLLGLLNDLLDLSKFEAGMMKVLPVAQDVLPVISESLGEMESWAQSQGLSFSVEQRTENTVAAVDAPRLGQVIRNLLSNAIKYSPQGGRVQIILSDCFLPRGRRSSDAAEIPGLQIEIRDQGCGIPEAELDRIFDKFVQSSKTKTGAGGTGLGLAICREIILAHRGSIRACNNPEQGASLVLTVPRAAPQTSREES